MRPVKSKSVWRRRAAAVALVVAAPGVAGCAGLWPTDEIYNPGVGVNNRASDVNVLGATIVSGSPGQGNFIATLVNRSTTPDQLTSVEADGMTVAGGATPDIAAQGLVNLAETLKGIPITGDAKKLEAGRFVLVRLTFKNADPVTLNVPVVANTGPYAELAPSASPTA